MSQQVTTTSSIDEVTLKMRASGEIYVDAASVAALLVFSDTANGKQYTLTLVNGKVQPVEV